jgi:hypothetical protein
MRLALFALVCLLHLPHAARAAVLIEMTLGTAPMRMVIDRPQQRVLIQSADRRIWFDLTGGLVYYQGDGRTERAHARYRPGHDRPPPYRIERFGPGPIVAGQASTYQVLFAGERICAEMMVSKWMRPFVDPGIRAIALLQQLRGIERDDPCAAIPLTTYAAAGWPLLAGKSDRPTLATRAIAFDYMVGAGELTPPTAFVEVPMERLVAALNGYGW